jgi:quercetin dioxygenase-like cupin family protein
MNPQYLYIDDLTKDVDIPKNGILSRTLYSDDQVKVVLFGFDAGQELSSHTASTEALVHIVKGEARLTLGGDAKEAREGSWARMAPQLEHAVYAKTPVVMLLLLMR